MDGTNLIQENWTDNIYSIFYTKIFLAKVADIYDIYWFIRPNRRNNKKINTYEEKQQHTK